MTKLTKEDSEKFRKQVTYGRPSQAAVQTLKEGRALLKTLERRGSVSVNQHGSRDLPLAIQFSDDDEQTWTPGPMIDMTRNRT